MSYDYSLQDIAKETGLKVSYIRAILRDVPEFELRYGSRGENNRLLFNSSGLDSFRQLLQAKEQGTSRKKLLKLLQGACANRAKTDYKQESKPSKEIHQSLVDKQFDEILSLQKQLLTESKKNAAIESTVKMLTAGKSYADFVLMQHEREEKLKQAQEKIKALEETAKREEEHKEHLLQAQAKIKELEDVTKREVEQQEKLLQAEQQKALQFAENADKIVRLSEELLTLGFFSGKRKREIQEEIKELQKAQSELKEVSSQSNK